MSNLIKFFLDRPLLVNLASVMILIVGGISILLLQKESFPNVDFDLITIRSIYPGSSPEDVEKLVTISLERELAKVNGIDEMSGMSLEGSSIIFLKIDPAHDVTEVLNDVKSAVDQVQDLPSEVETPIVSKARHQKTVIKVALSGAKQFELRKLSRQLRDELEQIREVAVVDIGGEGRKEIHIKLNPEKLNNFEITSTEVSSAIQARNMNVSAGKLQLDNRELAIRTVGEFSSMEEINDVVIRSNANGFKVKVSDVAVVEQVIREDSVLQRSNGKRAIYLSIKKKESADIIKTTAKVKESVEEFFTKTQNKNLKYDYTDDQSFYVKRRLRVLQNNGMFGFTLVFCCLLFFLNFRTSLVTSLGAPIAFMTAFALMDGMGFTINLISMFGLILVLGMLVDDSIIVAEHYYQKVEDGLSPYNAAWTAARETVLPVSGTILTTIVAFGSIFFMGGIMGKFLWPVPAVVILCLIASWIECFFFLPSHLAEFAKVKKSKPKTWYKKLSEIYKGILNVCLRHNILTCCAFIFIFVLSVLVAKNMEFELFPGDDVRVVNISVTGPVGSTRENTNEALIQLEKEVLAEVDDKEMEQLRSLIGLKFGQGGSSRTGSHYGTMILYLTEPTLRLRSTDDILEALSNKIKTMIPSYTISMEKIVGGPPKGKPVDIEIFGDDLNYILDVSKKVLEKLGELDGVLGPELDFEEGKKQLMISVDEAEAKRLGLSTQTIAAEVRRSLAGDSISQIRGSNEDVDIVIQYDRTFREDINILEKMFILNNRNQRISLSKVAKFNQVPAAFVIRRKNKKRVISVQSTLNKKILNPLLVEKKMKPKLIDLQKEYPDFSFSFGGENKDTKESVARLGKAGIISLFCIFIILVAMFASLGQPIVIMAAIPLGLIGVVITFKVMGLAFSFMALMGLIGLLGVVVNDSIVLMNFINIKIKEIAKSDEAILTAAQSRFRAVILTTFTTVAGLLPIAHAPGGDPFLKPMALSFAWGLLFSTGVTLLFIPCAFKLYYGLGLRFGFIQPYANLNQN